MNVDAIRIPLCGASLFMLPFGRCLSTFFEKDIPVLQKRLNKRVQDNYAKLLLQLIITAKFCGGNTHLFIKFKQFLIMKYYRHHPPQLFSPAPPTPLHISL